MKSLRIKTIAFRDSEKKVEQLNKIADENNISLSMLLTYITDSYISNPSVLKITKEIKVTK